MLNDTARIAEALNGRRSKSFWIENVGGEVRIGDKLTCFGAGDDAAEITFDIGNNKTLANVSPNGTLKCLTIYRDSYRGCSIPLSDFPGVWLGKDCSSFGSYSFSLELGGETIDLDTSGWDYRTGLLDNIFPLTELRDPKGRCSIRLLAFAPISSDGSTRLRGIVYGLWLSNTGGDPLVGKVLAPKSNNQDRPRPNWAAYDPFEFEIALADGGGTATEIAFELSPGEGVWAPALLYQPGDRFDDEVVARGAIGWFDETARYYRAVLGRIETPQDPWLGEFFERELLQALHSVAMSASGSLSGSNWGSYPATRQIWMKDCFYSCLACIRLEPGLAQEMILWFDRSDIRHKGYRIEGGINHSISCTVASIMLAGIYYDETGDKSFFALHSELRARWSALLRELIESRQDPDIWLMPSRYISDGRLEGDWHCGSNVAVWFALRAFARLELDVHDDSESAARFAADAEKAREAILRNTVIDGPFGRQFIEAIGRDGSVPRMTSDGEESETALMPYLGFLPYDDETYLNYMKFSMSEHNAQYVALTRSINWGSGVPSTAPGYNKGLCAGIDAESLFGEHGYFTEIRRVTEVDGSVWWWPVRIEDGDRVVPQRTPGKAGWFAGVYCAVFTSRFLGLTFDAPSRRLKCAPLMPSSDFKLTDFPFGAARFDIAFARNTESAAISVRNRNAAPIEVEAWIPVADNGSTLTLTVGGQTAAAATEAHLGRLVVKASATVAPNSAVEFAVTGGNQARPEFDFYGNAHGADLLNTPK
jgi:hypothetical protein